MADGVEGSAVVDKRDHRLLPGPKHGIHQQSQQQNVVTTTAFSTETSLCLGQPRLNSISHVVQNQHGQQLIAVAHQSNCSVIAKVVPRALLVKHHKCSAYKGWWDHLGFPYQAHDSKELLLCGGRATIRLYRDTVTTRRLVVVQHPQASLQFFLCDLSVVVVSCYRCIRSTRQVGAREFPAEELLPGIQQLLRLGERLAVDILGRHDVSMVFPSAGQRFRQPRHLAHVAHTVRRLDVAHLVVDVAAIVVSTRSPDIGMLKVIAPVIIKPLTLLINQVLNTGTFPDKLKIAKVIPIFKKGDPSLFENYRPISLLPAISKVVEKIIALQLSSYFEKNKLLFDNQYGFRPKHSTEHAALELIDRSTNKMDTNEIPLNIFIDLSKAFDTIDHSILLNKLKYYGLKGSTLNLFQSYLSNRKQYTEIEDTTSTILPIQVGVPQGSILGPILFIIYVNDLPQCSNKFDFIMYADDTTLSSTIDSFCDINSNASADSLINAEIDKVIEWLKINKVSLNKNKSKYMTFHMPKKQIQHLTLKIDGINIEKVEEFNFLGLTMDTNLKWKKHTDKISNKCSKITGVLNRLKLLFPQEIKCLLYNSLIVPHINYCITAWGFHRNRITIIQKKAIRIITASSYISHTEPLFKQLNLLKVEDILTLQELKFYFKYNQGILPKYLQNWNFIPNSKIHNHNTRKITTLHTFKTKHEFAKKPLKYNLPYTINNTPHIVKDKVNTHSFQGFSLYVKQYLIRKYNTNCISRNCYICEQNA